MKYHLIVGFGKWSKKFRLFKKKKIKELLSKLEINLFILILKDYLKQIIIKSLKTLTLFIFVLQLKAISNILKNLNI